MRKKQPFFILSMLFILSVFYSVSATSVSAGTVKLTYSNFFPPLHIQSRLAESWCREVEKRTLGKVKIEYYPGGTLTKAKQCYDGVVEGLSDIGFSVLGYSRGRFPVMAVIDLPLGYTSGVAATQLANLVYENFMPKEFRDTEIMYFHAHGPGLIHTRSMPVRKLKDIKGLKLRATGNSAKIIKALGGTPVAMSMPDSYQSIQKGIVKGGIYPVETNKGWKMGEVVDYCTASYSAAYSTAFFVAMNKDKWNSLPTDIRKTIEQINAEWIVKHGEAWDNSDAEGMKFFLNQGNDIIGLDKKEAAKWKNAVMPIIDNYIKEINSRGLNGKHIVDFTIKTLDTLQ
jgi:TRAP-type transport system periplasmic protein